MLRRLRREAPQLMLDMQRQYGDAVRWRFFGPFWGYFFFHPDQVKHILVDNNHNYTKEHPALVNLRVVLGRGLLTSDGDFWLRQRRLAQPAFHRRRLEEFSVTMNASTQRMLEHWQARAAGGEIVNVDAEMMRLTLEITGRTLFGIDLTGTAATVGDAFNDVNEILSDINTKPFGGLLLKFPWLPRMRRLYDGIRQLDGVVAAIIAERRREESVDRGDLLAMLMLARDEETGEGMTDSQLRDEVMTILLAGHETTAVALSWAFYLLSNHPEVRRQLRAELSTVLAGRTPTVDDLPRLTYTRMVLDETLRLFPPAYSLARAAADGDVVGDFDVEPGGVITLSSYVTHRHPEFWDDPERFDPERFTPEAVKERHRFAYFPFGGGPRLCIGNNFAMMEMQLVLAAIVQRFDLDLVSDHEVGLEPLITLRPRHGVPMRLRAVHTLPA
jgi:cytochrome P450